MRIYNARTMKQHLAIALAGLTALTLAACLPASNGSGQSSSSASVASSEAEIRIQVTNPQPNQVVTSPLTITGQARGTWYFEASFPVKLLDGNGNQIAIAPAQAQGDWMTENFVPFSVTLTFATPSTPAGTLVLEKDNPSGLPEHAAQITIPVQFQHD